MNELLILGVIIAVVILFFNREWIKTDSSLIRKKNYNYTIDDQFNSDKRERGERNRQTFE